MATTADKRRWWSGWYGEQAKRSKSVRVPFYGANGRVWRLPVADVAGPAFRWLSDTFRRYEYGFDESAGGTWVVRPIASSGKPSLHSYGIALDINPRRNPFRKPVRHDYPPGLIEEVTGLRTKNGRRVFRWGGEFGDAMHWELDCRPADLRTGLDIEEDDMPTYRTVRNVPDADWAKRVVDWGIEEGVIVTGDDAPDDWDDDRVTMGRLWVLLYRQRD